MYLSRTVWVFWFKLFHNMPMPYHWFKNKWKTLILCNLYQTTSANNITISLKRLYKNNFANTVYKNYNTTIVRLVDVNIMSSKIWDIVSVSKFKTRSKIMTLLIKK